MKARAEYMGRVLRCKRCGHAFRWLADGENAARAAEEARVIRAHERESERANLQRRLRMLEVELAEARLRADEEAERADGFRAGRDSLASDHDALHGLIESLERELGDVTGQRDDAARALDLMRAERDGLASETQRLRSREAALVADLAASSSGSRDESWWQPVEVEGVQAERDEAVAENARLRAERDAATCEARMHEGGLRAVEDRLAEVQASLQAETARAFRLHAELASTQEAAMAELAFGIHDRARV